MSHLWINNQMEVLLVVLLEFHFLVCCTSMPLHVLSVLVRVCGVSIIPTISDLIFLSLCISLKQSGSFALAFDTIASLMVEHDAMTSVHMTSTSWTQLSIASSISTTSWFLCSLIKHVIQIATWHWTHKAEISFRGCFWQKLGMSCALVACWAAMVKIELLNIPGANHYLEKKSKYFLPQFAY